jgi:hypothetical protein
LDETERRRLMRYLHSPYFNQSKTYAKLCETLLQQIERGKEGFDRHAAWQKLFPGEPYDDVNFRKYCSDLLKQVEAFMAQEAVAQDELTQSIGTLDFVIRRKVERLFSSALRQARTDLEKRPYRSLDYYYKAYTVERHYYSMMDFDVKMDVRSNLEEISENLDLFYWIEKLKLHIAALSQKKTRNYTYNLHFIEEITHFLKRFPIEKHPELAVYYYAYLTLHEENNLEHYYNLRRILDQYGAVMPQEEAIELFESALHYCTGKINQGDRNFLQEYFDLFEDAIEKGIFLQKGELAPWRFNNMIAAALRLGKLDWAENFIERFKDFLPTDTRLNTYSFNLARVYRYQGKFDKVLSILRNVEYEDIGYNLISKAMLVITYYELDEFDTLDSFTESFRVFLNRHKKNLPQQVRKSYLNLIKYTRSLTRLVPRDKAAVEKLRAEITREKASTVNHEWLLEKLDELA